MKGIHLINKNSSNGCNELLTKTMHEFAKSRTNLKIDLKKVFYFPLQ